MKKTIFIFSCFIVKYEQNDGKKYHLCNFSFCTKRISELIYKASPNNITKLSTPRCLLIFRYILSSYYYFLFLLWFFVLTNEKFYLIIKLLLYLLLCILFLLFYVFKSYSFFIHNFHIMIYRIWMSRYRHLQFSKIFNWIFRISIIDNISINHQK